MEVRRGVGDFAFGASQVISLLKQQRNEHYSYYNRIQGVYNLSLMMCSIHPKLLEKGKRDPFTKEKDNP